MLGRGNRRHFFGRSSDNPLSASYPECPNKIKSGKTIYKPDGGSTCWEHYGSDAVLLRAGELFKIYVQSVDGKVASITASFKHSDFDKIAKKLIAKYGEPQRRNHPPVSTKDVHNLPSEGLDWFGRDIQLTCMSSSTSNTATLPCTLPECYPSRVRPTRIASPGSQSSRASTTWRGGSYSHFIWHRLSADRDNSENLNACGQIGTEYMAPGTILD